MTLFMLLSSWQSYCINSPSSSDERRTGPSVCWPSNQADRPGYESACRWLYLNDALYKFTYLLTETSCIQDTKHHQHLLTEVFHMLSDESLRGAYWTPTSTPAYTNRVISTVQKKNSFKQTIQKQMSLYTTLCLLEVCTDQARKLNNLKGPGRAHSPTGQARPDWKRSYTQNLYIDKQDKKPYAISVVCPLYHWLMTSSLSNGKVKVNVDLY